MTRQRVALLSHVGYDHYRHADGRPFLPPDEFDITLLAPPRAIAGAVPEQVSRRIPVDLLPSGDLARPPAEVVGDLRFDWVVATQERLLLPAARLRESMGVGGMGTEHTLLLRDKVAMKRHFAAQGIRVPEFVEISEPVQATELLGVFGRIVIKPVLGSSSADVHVIRAPKELIGLQRRGFATSDRYEAEQFIEGRQFHIDSVVKNGVPIAATVSRYLDSHETFPLDGQIRSHSLDPGPERELLTAFNREVLRCIPWFSGAAHLEAFLDDRGSPVFCELGGRPGGAGIESTFRHRHGVSLFHASVLPQVGRDVPDSVEQMPLDRPATGWSMIYPSALGRFRGFDAPPRADWLLQLTTPYQPGDVVGRPEKATHAIAVAAVCGQDAHEVVDRLAQVKRKTVVTITPE